MPARCPVLAPVPAHVRPAQSVRHPGRASRAPHGLRRLASVPGFLRAAHRVALVLTLWLLGLGLAAAAVHPVRGFLPDLKFSLQGAGGTTVTQQDFAGKVVLMFFGYASCPDICPTTMAQLAHVTEALGPQADQVRILFISVDPHRDTPDILQAYVDQFDRHAIGLTGNERAIADLARRYRVAYQIDRPRGGDPTAPYEVAHSRGIYCFDQQGRAVWLAPDAESEAELIAALRPLLH